MTDSSLVILTLLGWCTFVLEMFSLGGIMFLISYIPIVIYLRHKNPSADINFKLDPMVFVISFILITLTGLAYFLTMFITAVLTNRPFYF